MYDLLDIDDEMREYVTNYRLNLYDCHAHDTFEEYHTGLRQLFEMLRYGRDREKLEKIMEANREAYSNIDSETKELLEVVAKIKIPEEYKMAEGKEERFDMCKAWADNRLEGKLDGKRETILELLEDCGKVSEDIINKIMQENDMVILTKWCKAAARSATVEEFAGQM